MGRLGGVYKPEVELVGEGSCADLLGQLVEFGQFVLTSWGGKLF